jgi:hypothetical protein
MSIGMSGDPDCEQLRKLISFELEAVCSWESRGWLRSYASFNAPDDPFWIAAQAFRNGRPLRPLVPGRGRKKIKRKGSVADTLRTGFPEYHGQEY